MKPAQAIYYPPAGLQFEVKDWADEEVTLDGRARDPYRPLPASHERILVKVAASLGYRKKGDLLIFERPL